MTTKIRAVFIAPKPGQPSWPHVDYDVEARADEVLARLREALPDIEFSHAVYRTIAEAEAGYEREERDVYDGWFVFLTCLWPDIGLFYARTGKPVVVADDLYCGTAQFLRLRETVDREKLRVAMVASSDFADVVRHVRLIDVMRRMRESRILVVTNKVGEHWGSRTERVEALADIFGVGVEYLSGNDLQAAFAAVGEAEAAPVRDRWWREAKRVVEPDAAEGLRSARLYLAMRRLLEEHRADAITVDCLGLFYAGEAPAYPCLGFFQLNNEGKTGVCEGDLDSTVCQLLFRHLADRPAYVSDPVIDEGARQIIYAHCVATNRAEGCGGCACDYVIRSHAEDRKGASVQTLLPLNKTVTTIALASTQRMLALHTARTVGNIDDEKACRTKLAAEVDTDLLLANYRFVTFGWHQVTCYGDHRRELGELARLYGLRLFEQDRPQPIGA